MGNANKKNSNKSNFNNEVLYMPEDIYILPLTKYKYFERRVPYMIEVLKYSKEEEKFLSELKPDKINLTEFSKNNDQDKIKVIIDMDIGTDWDDAMALAFALNLQNIEILGITTNYGFPD